MADRSKLLWFGRPPGAEDLREARNRNLVVEIVDEDGQPDFRHARAAVFWATPPHFESAALALEKNAARAIDEGLYLYVVVESEGQRKNIAHVLDGKRIPTDRYRLRTSSVACHEAPNAALAHTPGPAANELLGIDAPANMALLDEHILLLQRAFHDCKSVKIELIPGGLSGAFTFLVAATLSASNAGPNPVPFFAKLHKSDKARNEMRSFREFAEHHIDWYLRPNFLPERCIYGVNHGILVGSFVRSSKSLWEIARAGEGPRHIRSLFGETLGVLRQEAKPSGLAPAGSVIEPLEQFCNYSRIPDDRVELAKSFGGIVHSPLSLWRKLLNLPPERWRRSAIHGDMHGENVRVRNGDAIVIDFAHATTGPMSADLASLEVWLAFKVPPDCLPDQEKWRRDVETLYRTESIDLALAGRGTELHQQWLSACVQELRALARDSICTAEEYKRVLAVYLLRQARFPADTIHREEDEFRRAYAYWLANRLVASLCAARGSRLEVA